jgi:hypothetical protein
MKVSFRNNRKPAESRAAVVAAPIPPFREPNMTRPTRENSSRPPRDAAAEQRLAAEASRSARLARIAALMGSCATLGLLAGCGGGADAAPQATQAAATGAHGRVAIQAAAATVPAPTPAPTPADRKCVG